jgi:hypothetical protein
MVEAGLQPKTPRLKNGKKSAEKLTGKRKSEVLANGHLQQRCVVVTAPGSIIATVNWLGPPLPFLHHWRTKSTVLESPPAFIHLMSCPASCTLDRQERGERSLHGRRILSCGESNAAVAAMSPSYPARIEAGPVLQVMRRQAANDCG